MKVQVLYFAVLRELLGRDGEALTLPVSVRTVADFIAWLPSVHGQLAGRLASVRLARNEVFARDDDELLADGDVLALIPPVAGGC